MQTDSLSVCVIGAGPSGLVAIKELLDEGRRVTCLEKTDSIGGVFSLSPTKNGAYDSVELTVSNYYMAFSSMPPLPEEPRRFWTHREYADYIWRFAKTFDLLQHITFSADVCEVSKREDDKFSVVYTVDGSQQTKFFDAVAICCGAHCTPKVPEIDGLENFTGEVLHSYDYRNAKPFHGRQVVCVGMGETAADVVHEVAGVARSCTLSIRQYPAVVPKYLGGHTSDSSTSRAMFSIPRNAIDRRAVKIARHFLKEVNTMDESEYDPIYRLISEWTIENKGVARKFLTKSEAFIPDILANKLDVNAAGIQEVRTQSVIFKDGTESAADTLLFNTGYQISFPFLKDIDMTQIRKLFRHMIHPDIGPRLALIGFVRPAVGGIPACAEMQSRVFARLCSGKLKLPEANRLRQITMVENQREENRFDLSQEIKTMAPYVQYMDAMAGLCGCYPLTPGMLFREPGLFYKLWYGSLVSCQYRLRGDHATPEQAREILEKLPVVWSKTRMFEYAVKSVYYGLIDKIFPKDYENIYQNKAVLKIAP